MRSTLKLFSLALTLSALGLAQAKPNILFIFADDLSYEAVGAWNPEVKTPNLDRLVGGGTNFSHAYNMGSWSEAVCIGSRTMLNTGRSVLRAHTLSTSNAQSWTGLMEAAGYRTYFTGKWHADHVTTGVFDVKGTQRPGMAGDHFGEVPETGYQRPVEGRADKWSPYDKSLGGYWAGGTHWSAVVANETIGFLNKAKTEKAPFFMYVAFNAPHDPRQSPKEYKDMYPPDSISVPDDFQPEYPNKDKIGVGDALRDEHLAPFPRTRFAVRTHRSEYFAAITYMDYQIGRILDALEASGKKESTYVIFTADHGLACGHHGLLGKQNMYEHSLRAPFFVAGPGIAAGRNIDARIYIQDAMATAIDWAGIAKPARVEFKSVKPLISGAAATLYDEMYATYLDKQRMILKGDYKLIYYPALEQALLFNLRNDPTEVVNLIASPSHASVANTLWSAFKAKEAALGRPASAIAAYKYVPPAIVGDQVPLEDASASLGKKGASATAPDIGQSLIPPQFRNQPAYFEVFGLSGEFIARIKPSKGDLRWNGRLPSGEAAKPGVYLLKYGRRFYRQMVGT